MEESNQIAKTNNPENSGSSSPSPIVSKTYKSLSYNDAKQAAPTTNLSEMFARFSPSKPQFWKSNSKGPGVVKSVTSDKLNVKFSQSAASLSKSDGIELKQRSISSDQDLSHSNPSPTSSLTSFPSQGALGTPGGIRQKKFEDLLKEDSIDLVNLRKMSWKGIPTEYRAMVWKLLLVTFPRSLPLIQQEYLPTNKDRRDSALERKRKEYSDAIPKFFDIDDNLRTSDERALYKQIQIDVPRTNSSIKLFQSPIVQQCLARILYVWSIRHPASGYVQGMNDLVTPFFIVFMSEQLQIYDQNVIENYDVNTLSHTLLDCIEADCYWCLSRLLDGIQDNYTFAQLGIQRACNKLSDIVHRVDAPLHEHLKLLDIPFIQFAFRWMNCLLIRELPLSLIIRTWDTYLAEVESFGVFHVYVCAAFLQRFSDELRHMEFQDVMLFLKTPPTLNWKNKEIEMLLSQAFLWQTLFEDAPKHLEET